MQRSQCPHIWTTGRGSNFWQMRKTCRQCGALLQFQRTDRRGHVENARSEEASSSSGTVLADGFEQAATTQPATAAEIRWSQLARAYTAHARAMARAKPARARRQPVQNMTAISVRQAAVIFISVILAFAVSLIRQRFLFETESN